MGQKAQYIGGTCTRAVRYWLKIPARTKPWCPIENGHMYTGTESLHLSKGGCGFRALIRMRIRLGLKCF